MNDMEDIAYVRVRRKRHDWSGALPEYSITVLDTTSVKRSSVTTAGFSTLEAAMAKTAELLRACVRAREGRGNE